MDKEGKKIGNEGKEKGQNVGKGEIKIGKEREERINRMNRVDKKDMKVEK